MVRTALSGVMRLNEFDDLYTDPSLAVDELKVRNSDSRLQVIVREALGTESTTILEKLDQPRAILPRHIATPTHETLRFIELAQKMGLKPLILEYLDDKFVSSENRSKRALGKMPVFQFRGSDGRDMVKYQMLCDFNSSTGKKIRDVQCVTGETLVDLHHRLFTMTTGLDPADCAVDASGWFKSLGGKAELYYEKMLTLIIRDGILFENFMPLRSEGAFAKTVVAPAFEKIRNKYGLSPLIVRLLPESEEMRQYWDAYPLKTMDYLWT